MNHDSLLGKTKTIENAKQKQSKFTLKELVELKEMLKTYK